MGTLLASYVFAMASLCMGSVVCSVAFGFRLVSKITIVWAVIITVAFFTNIIGLVLVTIFYAILIKNESSETKLLYYVALMPLLPLEWYMIPFPGLNYLWDVNFIRILALVLFVPLFLQHLSSPSNNKRFLSTDLYFLFFMALIFIMSFRLGNITYSLRALLNVALDFGIPYFVISRYLVTAKGLHWIFCGFMISAAFISFFSIIESVKMWRFYSQVFFSLNLLYEPMAMVAYSRDGVVRAAGGPMFSPLSFAYFISLAIVVCFYFWKKKLLGFLPSAILIGIYLIALFLTGSRGGVLIVTVGVFMVYYLDIHKGIRFILNIAGIIIVPLIVGYFLTVGFGAVDDEGTFDYRFQLILNSMDAISQNPIFGSNDFLTNASLEQSYQGEGIIDVVNTYLQVVLEYGFVGLFVYVMIFLSLVKSIVLKPAVAEFDHGKLLLALIAMTMIFIATCSNVSFIPHYIMLIWAITRAYISFQEVRIPSPENTSLKFN